MSEFDFKTFEECFNSQVEFFESGETIELRYRAQTLKKLRGGLKKHETRILEALYKDLGKPAVEAFGSEVGFLYGEISHALKNLKKWMKPRKVKTPLFLFPAGSKIVASPKGQVLIIAPWNYPVQLQFAPLVGALAAGNTAILKPSEIASHSEAIMKEIIEDSFSPSQVAVFTGDGKQTISEMTAGVRFDHIFFTGSVPVGKIIAENAAKKLTPVTLELGGKSPAIVDKSANVKLAAKRITWGKFYNAGQTCVAPDYVIVDESLKDEFVKNIKRNIETFYGADPIRSESLATIINENHFDKLINYLDGQNVLIGGGHDRGVKKIEPTVVDLVDCDGPLFSEEIFGPILPIITVADRNQIFDTISSNPNPLALYIFANDKRFESEVMNRIPFGGGCINDVVAHLANPNLPFGGIGTSGIGKCHGKFSFDEFSNQKGLLQASQKMDLPFRYPPYDEKKLKMIRRLLK